MTPGDTRLEKTYGRPLIKPFLYDGMFSSATRDTREQQKYGTIELV